MDTMSYILAKKNKKALALPTAVGGVSVLDEQTEYYIGTQTAINIAFPTTATNGDYCFVCFTAGTSASLTITGDCVGDTSITLEEAKTYEVLATYNGTNWVVSYISY